MGMVHLAYRNTNASLVSLGEQPLPAQVTHGATKAARNARVAKAQCKQQLAVWHADPSNCNLCTSYFCSLHISFDVPRLEAVLNRAAGLTGCAGRDNVYEDAGREGGKEGSIIGEKEGGREGPPTSSVKATCSLSHCPATSGGWPRPGARWCPAMYTGQEVSPWNRSTGICHDLSWPSYPVRSDVQIQLNNHLRDDPRHTSTHNGKRRARDRSEVSTTGRREQTSFVERRCSWLQGRSADMKCSSRAVHRARSMQRFPAHR